MNTMIENLINGNLTEAKAQAKRYGADNIKDYLLEQGWSSLRAFAAAMYLKWPSNASWQRFCDAL